MKKRLVLYICMITTVALLLMFGLGILVTKNNNYEQGKANIIAFTQMYAKTYTGDNNIVSTIAGSARLTIISSSGEVLADSTNVDISTLDNHIHRGEIVAALENNPTVFSRRSTVTGEDTLYYAEKVDLADEYVFIRVSQPRQSIDMYVAQTIPLTLLIFFLSLCFSTILGILMSDNVVKPYTMIKKKLQAVNDGTYTRVFPSGTYNEVNEILSDINDISNSITINLKSLSEEKDKLDYILNNINEGIVAIDSDENICLINNKLNSIFNIDVDLTNKKIDFLTSNQWLKNSLIKCIKNEQNSVFELEVEKDFYLVTIKNLGGSWQENGKNVAIAIMSDITSIKKNEKLRSEFFANASHELKTPLTAIKGFNELLQISNKDKSLEKHIEQIKKESERMLVLIDDMLKLSQLESTNQIDAVEVNLLEVCQEVVGSLETVIGEKNINVNITGIGTVRAEHKHIYELVKNLVENSVKYNNDNGTVEINILKTNKHVSLEVADTGIGIDAKHQSRIFERFYRVEKSRSRKAGGTGLGLSIVKHICLLYDAEISLTSKIGVGTSIKIVFKK